VGLVANQDASFRVILAGSLGAKPGLGLLAYDALPLGDVLPLIVAVLRLFHAEGERTHRSRARLRHLRQRLGDEAFRNRVEEVLQTEKQQNHWPVPRLQRVEGEVPLRARLHLRLGDIAPDVVLEMVESVRASSAEVRLGVCHDLLIFAETKPSLTPRLAALSAESCVVACPGATWCTRGLVDCRTAANRIRCALPGACGLQVGVTGCPNSCSQAATADIGLIGRLLRRKGQEHAEGFRLVAGGGKGETPTLAEELHPGLPAETVHEAVRWVAQEYQRARADRAASFADFVAASAGTLRDELTRRYDHGNSGS
jgi:ferredoxin-nitrite reductase